MFVPGCVRVSAVSSSLPHNGAHDRVCSAQEVTAGGVGSERLPLNVSSTHRKVGDEHVYAGKQENRIVFPFSSPIFWEPQK